ncbi:MAG: 50S ribosomal protein L9 [Bacteroidales bacterium]|nr:50S ribosomal protein L9 [Bacteroidales bacterium]
MEIILIQDVINLGQKDDIIKVKDGYAQNYLIPKGLAITANPSAKKILAENVRQRAHKEAKIREEAQALAAKMEGIQLTIGAKTSTTGKIFGSVNTIQIAEALSAKGFDIDRKSIYLSDDAIKETGNYKVKVKLHREVFVQVDLEVIAE